jgi:hypothetical protein
MCLASAAERRIRNRSEYKTSLKQQGRLATLLPNQEEFMVWLMDKARGEIKVLITLPHFAAILARVIEGQGRYDKSR